MRKLFNSKKTGLKNESAIKFLNSLKSWGFFAVACCITLFMYIYAHSNNELVRADETEPIEESPYLVNIECYLDNQKEDINSEDISSTNLYKLISCADSTNPGNETDRDKSIIDGSCRIEDLTGNTTLKFTIGELTDCYLEKISTFIDTNSDTNETVIKGNDSLFINSTEATDVNFSENSTIRFYFLSKRVVTLNGNNAKEINYKYTYAKDKKEDGSYAVTASYDSTDNKLYVPNGCDLIINATLETGYTACANDEGFALKVNNAVMTSSSEGYTCTIGTITSDQIVNLSNEKLRKDKIIIPNSVTVEAGESGTLNDDSVKHCDIYIWEGNEDTVFPKDYSEPDSNGFTKRKCNNTTGIEYPWSTSSGGQKFKIFIVPEIGYDNSSYSVITKGIDEVTDEYKGTRKNVKVYECESFNGDYNISISGIKANTYNVKFKDKDNNDISEDKAKFSVNGTNGNTVDYDSTCNFEITLKDGYTQSKPEYKINGMSEYIKAAEKQGVGNENVYTGSFELNSISEVNNDGNVVVTIDGITENTYTVKLKSDNEAQNGTDGYMLSAFATIKDTSKLEVKYGSTFNLNITLGDGYTQSTPQFSIDNGTSYKEVTKNGNECTCSLTLDSVSAVEGDVNLVVKIKGIAENTYSIEFKDENGGNIDSSKAEFFVTVGDIETNYIVTYNSEFNVKIKLGKSYSLSKPKCKMGSGADNDGTVLESDPKSWTYQFMIDSNNIKSAVDENNRKVVITVSGIEINKYKVTFQGTKSNKNDENGDYCLSDRANVSGAVEDDGNYSAIVTDDGKGKAGISVVLTAKVGYRFQDTKNNKKITVKRGNTEVGLSTSTGYTLSDYELKINLSDIISDTNFKIEGIMYKQYGIEFVSNNGDYNTDGHMKSDVAVTYLADADGNAIGNNKLNETGTVAQKSTQYYYRIEISKRFKVSDSELNISISGGSINESLISEKIGDNVYKISFLLNDGFLEKVGNDIDNLKITISGLEAVMVKVGFKGSTEGCSFTVDSEKDPISTDSEKDPISTGLNTEYNVEYGKDLKFNINVNESFQFQDIDGLKGTGTTPEKWASERITHTGGKGSAFKYSYTKSNNTFTVEISEITEDIELNFKDLKSDRTYTINFKYNGKLLEQADIIPVYNMGGKLKYHSGGYTERGQDGKKYSGDIGHGFIKNATYIPKEKWPHRYLIRMRDNNLKFRDNANILSTNPGIAAAVKLSLDEIIAIDNETGLRCTDKEKYFILRVALRNMGDTDEVDINLGGIADKRNLFIEYPGSIINKDEEGIVITEQSVDSSERKNVALEDISNSGSLKKVKAVIDVDYKADIKIDAEGNEFSYKFYECDREGNEIKDASSTEGYSDNGIFNIGFEDDNKHYYIKISLPEEKQEVHFRKIDGIKYYRTGTNGGLFWEYISKGKKDNLEFIVKVDDGYDLSSLKLKFTVDNGSPQDLKPEKDPKDSNCYEYKIKGSDIENNSFLSVWGEISKKKYNVTFERIGSDKEEPANFVYNDSDIKGKRTFDNIIEHGDNFKFTVKVNEKYSQSDFKVYRDGSIEIKPYNGEYIINSVQGDISISTDDNFKVNQYVITFTPNEYVDYLDKNGEALSTSHSVKYGDKLDFKLTPKNGYKLNEKAIVLLTGNSSAISTSLKATNDIYTIDGTVKKGAGITEDVTITVKNVEDIVFKITLEKVDGVTYLNETGSVIYGTHDIKYGNNFEFSIVLDDAYDDSLSGIFVIVNDGKSSDVSAQKIASGRYIIPNVNQDIKIKVGNVFKNKYTVTFVKTEGFDYYDSKGKKIDGSKEVEQNASLEFKVSLYPAYSDSNITVMLGDKPMNRGTSGSYVIPNIDEDKTVTVIGVEKAKEFEIVNDINSLPDSVDSIDDANRVTEISKIYNSLSDEKKKMVSNADVLKRLQEQVKNLYHTSNGVNVDGLDWYLKLMVIPISTDTEVCGRIYKKLNSEYILSLYDIYLWDTLNDCRYTLPEGKSVVVTIPTPDMTYFEKPTGIHENNSGKIDYLALTFKDNMTVFEATSFSPMGIVASRSSTPGRSSLLDAIDANVDLIKDFALSSFGNSSSDKESGIQSSVFDDKGSGGGLEEDGNDNIEGNISEKYRSRNNRVTATGSALRLILVLMILILIALALWILYKRRKEKKKHKENT